ncbi:MAG: hypothetical protein HC897_14840 [Thermoanaerobaculia bacterium]|nr:hypothetical protein [Thermoanaerobaculia bacterium]
MRIKPFLLVAVCLLLAEPATAQRFLAFGDSITHGFGDTGVDCAIPSSNGGYPPRLERLLRQLGVDTPEVESFGVCGEMTAAGLSRIDSVLAEGGDAILLMEGTNDISGQVSVETIRFNISEMARKAREAGIEPVYSSVIPRTPAASPDGNNARAFLLQTVLMDDAEVGGFAFANPFEVFSDLPDLFLNYYSDPFHPNSLGYDRLAEAFVEPALAALENGCAGVRECVPNDTELCLNQQRFRIGVKWRDFEGETGLGQAVPLTGDTGYFWFFDDANVELIIKVLDGRGINEHFWVFYGALSNVEYTLTVGDTETGQCRTYKNPATKFASVGDTEAFFVPAEPASRGGRQPAEAARIWHAAALPAAEPVTPQSEAAPVSKMGCATGTQNLCLNQNRFLVEVRWRDFEGKTGTGNAHPLSTDTGYFWFFDPENVELMIKVLDGRPINGNFWVFYGALSNVEYDITVTDTVTGETAVYHNPLTKFASVGDTEAFQTGQ